MTSPQHVTTYKTAFAVKLIREDLSSSRTATIHDHSPVSQTPYIGAQCYIVQI